MLLEPFNPPQTILSNENQVGAFNTMHLEIALPLKPVAIKRLQSYFELVAPRLTRLECDVCWVSLSSDMVTPPPFAGDMCPTKWGHRKFLHQGLSNRPATAINKVPCILQTIPRLQFAMLTIAMPARLAP